MRFLGTKRYRLWARGGKVPPFPSAFRLTLASVRLTARHVCSTKSEERSTMRAFTTATINPKIQIYFFFKYVTVLVHTDVSDQAFRASSAQIIQKTGVSLEICAHASLQNACVRCSFWRFLPFLSFLFHHCYSCQKTSDRNNNDGKASLKRQISPETTTDTQDVSTFFNRF